MTEAKTAKLVKGVHSGKYPPTMATLRRAVERIEQERYEKISGYICDLEAQYNDLFSKASKIREIDLPGESKYVRNFLVLAVCQWLLILFSVTRLSVFPNSCTHKLEC